MTDRAEQMIAEAIENPGAPKSEQRLVREWEAARVAYEASGGPRWRMPIRPILVENAADGAVTFDGNVYRAPMNATFHEYDIGRLREGYGCLRCWQPFETPFPDACPLCRYPVAARQADDFAAEFEGPKWVGPSTSLTDEFDRMVFEGERKRHVPGSSISLPSGLVLPPGAKT